jgi:hypothetical protein
MSIIHALLIASNISGPSLASTHQPNSPEPKVYGTLDAFPTPELTHVELRGRSVQGTRFSLTIAGEEELVAVAKIEGRSIGQVRIPANAFSNLDLYSVKVRFDDHNMGIRMLLNFGDERLGCYYNHDGRDFLIYTFREGASPEQSIRSFENCRDED